MQLKAFPHALQLQHGCVGEPAHADWGACPELTVHICMHSCWAEVRAHARQLHTHSCLCILGLPLFTAYDHANDANNRDRLCQVGLH